MIVVPLWLLYLNTILNIVTVLGIAYHIHTAHSASRRRRIGDPGNCPPHLSIPTPTPTQSARLHPAPGAPK